MRFPKFIVTVAVFCVVAFFSGCSFFAEFKNDLKTNETSDSLDDLQTEKQIDAISNTNAESQISEENQLTAVTNTVSTLKNNGTMVPYVIVWNKNLYVGVSGDLSDSDLDEFLIDSENISVYSVLDESTTERIAYRANNKIYLYRCFYASPISVGGIDYYFVPRDSAAVNKVGEQPIFAFDGMNIYKSDNPEYLVVDISEKLGSSGPCLYDIKKVEDILVD